MTSKVTTLVEVESPSPSILPIEVEVINESLVPHFNPLLPNTLEFILQEVTITSSVIISSQVLVKPHQFHLLSQPSLVPRVVSQ